MPIDSLPQTSGRVLMMVAKPPVPAPPAPEPPTDPLAPFVEFMRFVIDAVQKSQDYVPTGGFITLVSEDGTPTHLRFGLTNMEHMGMLAAALVDMRFKGNPE